MCVTSIENDHQKKQKFEIEQTKTVNDGKTDNREEWKQLWGVLKTAARRNRRLTEKKGQGLPTDGQLCMQPAIVKTSTVSRTLTQTHKHSEL